MPLWHGSLGCHTCDLGGKLTFQCNTLHAQAKKPWVTTARQKAKTINTNFGPQKNGQTTLEGETVDFSPFWCIKESLQSHQTVSFLVEREKEIQEVRELKMLEALSGASGCKKPGRSKAEGGKRRQEKDEFRRVEKELTRHSSVSAICLERWRRRVFKRRFGRGAILTRWSKLGRGLRELGVQDLLNQVHPPRPHHRLKSTAEDGLIHPQGFVGFTLNCLSQKYKIFSCSVSQEYSQKVLFLKAAFG